MNVTSARMQGTDRTERSYFFWRTFLPIAAAIVAVFAIVVYYETTTRLAELKGTQRQQMQTAATVVLQELADVSADVRWAAHLPALRRMLVADSQQHVRDTEAAFQALVAESADIDQIRYLDEQGNELVRVQMRAGQAVVTLEDELQNKAERYYFRAARNRPPGVVYASRFDLNIEKGKIETPAKPVIRFATRVLDARGESRGVLVVNYLGDVLRERIRRLVPDGPGQTLLLNAEGHLLMAPDPAAEWGFMYGRPPEFVQTHPEAWRLLQRESGQFTLNEGLFTFVTVDPSAVLGTRSSSGIGAWKLVSVVEREDLVSAVMPLIWRVLLGAAVALLIAALLTAWFVRSSAERARLRRENASFFQQVLEKQGVLDLFIQHTPAAVAMFDRQLRYMAVSRRWYQDYGLSEDVIGRSHYEVFPEIPERWRDVHRRGLRGEVVRSDEDFFLRNDGSRYWLRWEVRPWYTAEGEVGGIVMLTENISDRKHAEQIRDGFIAKVSHELRTPITAVDGALKLLLGGVGGTLDDRANMLVETAHRNSMRLSVLVNDLLDLQKIKLGEMELHYAEVHIGHVVEDVCAACKPLGTQKGVELRIEHHCSHPRLISDGARLQQVLTNLVSNAIRHTPAGRQVTIRTECGPKRVRCEVIDQGGGVPQPFVDRIFEDFEQAEAGDTRTPGGSGLGLAISRALIEKLGGEIGFENLPGGGARFYFHLFREESETA